MKKVIRLTESDLARIVKRVIKENEMNQDPCMSSMDDTSMDEYINWDIKTTNCEGSRFGGMSSMGVDEDEDGNIIAFIRYCDGDDEELEYLKRKARYQICKENRLPSEDETLNESDLDRILKRVISESKKKPSKSEILKMSKDELKDVYGELEVKGEYHGNKGTFHHFKRTAIGDVVCSFRTDDTTPSGLKRNTQAVKVKNLDF